MFQEEEGLQETERVVTRSFEDEDASQKRMSSRCKKALFMPSRRSSKVQYLKETATGLVALL
ncbi:hypothetical protein TWF106_009188 [Orbilia oligospora]|uniref:Uncharacterized protein n=1 Tax=Orbilia oligospora TaxID=2813651 RepID=A0A7C8R1Q2_ORBOL|nr:hypothetical protein TWF106_009188 [Orbilia oligospora]